MSPRTWLPFCRGWMRCALLDSQELGRSYAASYARLRRHYAVHVKKLNKKARRNLAGDVEESETFLKPLSEQLSNLETPSTEHVEKEPLLELDPPPAFIRSRLELWEKLNENYREELASKRREEIEVTLTNGSLVEAQSWTTTPLELCERHFPRLIPAVLVARVDGVLWDLTRPLESSCRLEFLDFSSPDAVVVLRHSAAHVLGQALERLFGGRLASGPATEAGFFYDVQLPEGFHVRQSDYSSIDQLASSIAAERQPFQRIVVSKANALDLFADNDFKRGFVEKVDGDVATVYRCGPLVDLCRGPHISHTGHLRAFRVTKSSTVYLEGESSGPMIERVHGVAFPYQRLLKEWTAKREEAARRDHRKVGTEQNLFFFHDLSPGSPFFLPNGTLIYNRLLDMIKAQYRKRGFQEVITPNVFNSKLWQLSGHGEHYSDNMFKTTVDGEEFALKPMNCPGHCLLFDARQRSWRDLPLRIADFGVLHRNELKGALSGLSRVRRFQQDDAHIFCAPEQVKSEIHSCLSFMSDVYSVLGFPFQASLSTRPKEFIGDLELWDDAEKQLMDSG